MSGSPLSPYSHLALSPLKRFRSKKEKAPRRSKDRRGAFILYRQSGRQDLNLRPPAPEAGALPG